MEREAERQTERQRQRIIAFSVDEKKRHAERAIKKRQTEIEGGRERQSER